MPKSKRIIHVDIDAFYASVEELDFPELKGKAVAVGGLSENSIITTANYEARKYGVHSAMPIFIAKKLCPNLVVQPVRRKRYLEKSLEVFNVLKGYSPILEKVSIDEGYLDISHIKHNAVKTVYALKEEVFEKTGLTISVGMSYNKFLAKIASDWNKPNGFMIIVKDEVPDILLGLDISKIHGVGPKSQSKLRSLGINKVEEFLQLSEDFLFQLFGKSGKELYDRVRGIDNREVEISRERKSIGVERTFESTRDRDVLLDYLQRFCTELARDMAAKNIGANTLTIKIKDENFKVHTRGRSYNKIIKEYEEIYERALEIFSEIEIRKKLRLMGVTASNLVYLNKEQLSFF